MGISPASTPTRDTAVPRRRPRALFVSTDAATLRAFILPFADHFRARGWRVDGLAAGIESSSDCVGSFDRVWDVPWRRGLASPGNLTAIRRVREVIDEGQFDLVHVHTPVAAALTRIAVRGLRRRSRRPKVVYTAHGFHFRDGPSSAGHLPFRIAERVTGRWTDHLIVINHEDERLARTYRIVPPTRVEHMPGIGVDPVHFSSGAVDPVLVAGVRSDLGIPASAPVFTLIGEFVPRKRHADAVIGLAAMSRSDAHLILVGGGTADRKDAITTLARSLGVAHRVHLIGRVVDVRPHILAADALLQVSDREGLPRSVMEAMSLGVPVIGSDTPGTNDLLTDGRGYLVEVASPRSIAQAMEQVLDDPAEARSKVEAARSHVHETLQLPHIIARHERTYERLLGPVVQR